MRGACLLVARADRPAKKERKKRGKAVWSCLGAEKETNDKNDCPANLSKLIGLARDHSRGSAWGLISNPTSDCGL